MGKAQVGFVLALAVPITVLILAGCSPASGESPDKPDLPLNAVRVALPTPAAPPPAEPARSGDAKALWTGDARRAQYGYPGEEPQFVMACEGGNLAITRHASADPDGQALFALIGTGAIVRLPVDAKPLGGEEDLVWQGRIPANDPAMDIFLRGSVAGTLPGAGKIELPASGVVQAVVRNCRGGADANRPAAQVPIDESAKTQQ